ncbi:MAG TPA: hypothetical protein VL172_23020, partial [Kofleriaceae bacterium]|nr:hypothetical protein [Kofleriaceae bacterium]
MSRRALLLALGLAGALPSPARASGVRRDVAATTIFVQYYYLQPNSQYTVETVDLSAGGDTVLHVLIDDGRGTQLAANDDCPGSGSLRSCVTVAPSANWRLVALLVRSYSPSSIGSGTLKVCGPWCDWFWMPRYAGTTLAANESIGATARVMTVRRPQQPNEAVTASDTVLLARSATIALAGFDDEHGLRSTPETTRRMSRITMAASCPSCALTVGVPQWAAEGLVTLMWDTGGADCDADGWSDGLETAVGTPPCVRDWDGDGLDDGEEFYGVETRNESLQFPFWGANPAHKDVYVEADWVENLAGDPDQFRLTENAALDLIARYQADPNGSAANPDGRPGLDVHIDSGRPNRGTLFGTWGGATRITAAVGMSNCGGMSSSRVGFFRHAVEHDFGAGNGGGTCYNATYADGGHNAHELGHTLGLNHGGVDAAVQANCKPNYRSIMNYAPSTTFSPGRFTTPLDPVALDETSPYGNDPAVIGFLEQSPWYFTLERQNGLLTGNIDWNRDGLYEDAARGAPNFVDSGGGCEFGMMHRTVAPGPYAEGFQARLGSDGVYWFGIGTDSKMTYRKAAELATCDQSSIGAPCPGSWSAPVPVPGGAGAPVYAAGAGAAEWYWDLNNWWAPTIVVVYTRATDQRLMYQRVARDWWTGVDVWSAPQAVAPVIDPVPRNAEPTLVNLDNQLLLYLPDRADRIREYRFDGTSWIE